MRRGQRVKPDCRAFGRTGPIPRPCRLAGCLQCAGPTPTTLDNLIGAATIRGTPCKRVFQASFQSWPRPIRYQIFMGRCLIHFGMHKTGSTSIQEAFFRRLSDDQFHFVDLGLANCSPFLATAFLHHPMEYPSNRRLGKSESQVLEERENIRRRLLEQLAIAGKRNAILSSEFVCRMSESEFGDLCQVLEAAGFEVSAAGYVRRPGSYMSSSFQQRLKSGSDLATLAPDRLYPHYRHRFEKFEVVLGRERVRYWLFDTATFPSGCVVRDFCRRMEIAFGAEGLEHANAGLSIPAAALLYAYRKFGPGYGKGPTVEQENKLLFSHLMTLRGKPFRVHPEVVRPVLEANRDDMAWMESRLKSSLQEDQMQGTDFGIRDEEDLLARLPEATGWLADQLQTEKLQTESSPLLESAPEAGPISPQRAATLVDELRRRLFTA